MDGVEVWFVGEEAVMGFKWVYGVERGSEPADSWVLERERGLE